MSVVIISYCHVDSSCATEHYTTESYAWKTVFRYFNHDLKAVELCGSPVQRNYYAHMSLVLASAAIFRILPIGDNCVG